MKVFFGAAIQGHQDYGDRKHVYQAILRPIRDAGHVAYSEHTMGESRQEIIVLMEKAIGPLPKIDAERFVFVRNKMIEGVEESDAAIFEVSTPSLGTGIEIAHAYLRSRMGLKAMPILVLYEEGYWGNDLSTMIRGLTSHSAPSLAIERYNTIDEMVEIVNNFLSKLR